MKQLKTYEKRKNSAEMKKQMQNFNFFIRKFLMEKRDKQLKFFSQEKQQAVMDQVKDEMISKGKTREEKEQAMKEIEKRFMDIRVQIINAFDFSDKDCMEMFEAGCQAMKITLSETKRLDFSDAVVKLTTTASKKTHNPNTMEEIIIPQRKKVKVVLANCEIDTNK